MLVVLNVNLFARRDGAWRQADHVFVCQGLEDLKGHLLGIVAACTETAGKDDFQNGEGSTYLQLHVLPVRDLEQIRKGMRAGVARAAESVAAVVPPGQPEDDTIEQAFRDLGGEDDAWKKN